MKCPSFVFTSDRSVMFSPSDYRILSAGDLALVVEFGEGIDRALSARVHALDRALTARDVPGIRETVPTFRSLMIHYEPLEIDYATLLAHVDAAATEARVEAAGGRHWRLPICYEGEMAPDLPEVAERVGLTGQEVVALHASTQFHVYMLGFLPGQGYLGDNPSPLILPRRATPRLSIPAGSLAIAMGMSSIFPQVTPCGWHLIGRCPVPMWDFTRSDEPLLAADDGVRFHSVNETDFHRLQRYFADMPEVLTPDAIEAVLP